MLKKGYVHKDSDQKKYTAEHELTVYQKSLTIWQYRIWPNYRTVRFVFSKWLGTLFKYVSTYIKGTLKKISVRLV